MSDQMLDMMFSKTQSNGTRNMFHKMEILENIIPVEMDKNPKYAFEIYNVFLVAKEYGFPLFDRADFLYQSHCEELIERLVKGESLDPPTDAELLSITMDFFTNNAPGNEGAGVAYTLLLRVNKSVAKKLFPTENEVPREAWNGQFEEAIAALRNRRGGHTNRQEEFDGQFI